MLIFKIFRSHEWDALKKNGRSSGSPLDLADGFIHFSTAEQVVETVRLHFNREDGLVLCAVLVQPLGQDLKWEMSRGGALFPHLYRVFRMSDVHWHHHLELVDGTHEFPDLEYAV